MVGHGRRVSVVQTTVIGLGKMGSALATALVDRGHDTTVWNRTPGRLRDLAVTHAATVEEAFAANELVVLCLLVPPVPMGFRVSAAIGGTRKKSAETRLTSPRRIIISNSVSAISELQTIR